MSKKFSVVILALTICALLAACGENSGRTGNSTETSNNETDAVVAADSFLWKDDAGREVKLPENISRIIPSGPSAQVFLYALAPEMLVGLSDPWKNASKEIIPEQYRDLPYFGQFYNSKDMNLEALAAESPQLVIDIGEYKKGIEKDLDNFTLQTGISIVFLEAKWDNMDKIFSDLGKILGKDQEAKELSEYCTKVYERTREIMDQVGNKKVKTLYIQGTDGRNALAKGAYSAQMLDMLTENAAVVETISEKGLGNEVDLEQIALWNPDFVIFGTASIYDTVKNIPGWREVTAIENDNYVEAPSDPYSWMGTPPSAQRLLAMSWLPTILYPEYCNYDIKEEVFEFYQKFFHCNLTESQYDKLTENAFIK